MTRRKRRYERRKAAREAKRAAFLAKYDNYDLVCDRNNLFAAADMAKKHVMWKGTVQRWSIEQLLNTEKLYRDLKAGKDVRRGFAKFKVCERGKTRNISAVRFYERVVQKALCKYVLYPVYTKSVLFDNAASQKGKGTKFAADRMIRHLSRHFNRYGQAGYAVLVDFKGYFENIDHDVAKEIYRQKFKDKRLLKLIDDFIDAYGVKGLGLGSETSQMHAIYYPNKIDHAIVETHGHDKVMFGRYMDDSYILTREKKTAIRMLDKIRDWCRRLRITLSPKKTMIVRIKDGLKWLKTIFYLTATGKIIKKPEHKSVVRERRKLKKQINLLRGNALGKAELTQSFESWAGSMKRRNARLSVWNMRRFLWSIMS
ncbi:MAG: hypothetical protein IKN71_05570 [Alphaproteobacteria bacterium]|nr:hypothetical protein [Alphaproteobacteria bacterium]